MNLEKKKFKKQFRPRSSATTGLYHLALAAHGLLIVRLKRCVCHARIFHRYGPCRNPCSRWFEIHILGGKSNLDKKSQHRKWNIRNFFLPRNRLSNRFRVPENAGNSTRGALTVIQLAHDSFYYFAGIISDSFTASSTVLVTTFGFLGSSESLLQKIFVQEST